MSQDPDAGAERDRTPTLAPDDADEGTEDQTDGAGSGSEGREAEQADSDPDPLSVPIDTGTGGNAGAGLWRRAFALVGAGVALVVLGFLSLVSIDAVPTILGQIGAVGGLVAVCGGLYYTGVAHRRRLDRHERTVLAEVGDLRDDLRSTEYEELIAELNEQREIAERLLDTLPEQREEIQQLTEALAAQDETVRQLIEQDIEARREEINSLREVKDDL